MIAEELTKLRTFIDDCRYLAAVSLLDALTASDKPNPLVACEEDVEELEQFLVGHKELLDEVRDRCREVNDLLQNEDTEERWVLGATHFGINTYYLHCVDDNSLMVKLEGVMEDLPIFEQISVIHEIDLFTEWMPFCTESKLVKKVGKAELYLYLLVGLPVMSRDFAMKAFGADCLAESGKIVILGKSVPHVTDAEVPWKTTGWLHKRMHVKEFRCVIDVLSPTSAKTTIFSHIDLNAPLPQSLINFLIKQLAGVVLYKFQQKAAAVRDDALSTHAHRIREDRAFYEQWVLPRLRHYCALKGWPQPVIPSLLPAAALNGDAAVTTTDETAENSI